MTAADHDILVRDTFFVHAFVQFLGVAVEQVILAGKNHVERKCRFGVDEDLRIGLALFGRYNRREHSHGIEMLRVQFRRICRLTGSAGRHK